MGNVEAIEECCQQWRDKQGSKPGDENRVAALEGRDLVSYEYEAHKTDGSHLRMGLTASGMVAFLEHIGFLRWVLVGDPKYDQRHGWWYLEKHVRDPGEPWLDEAAGPLVENFDGSVGVNYTNMTGYDLVLYLRKWLESKRFGHLSVCEVILTQEEFESLRGLVGVANVFWSHVQIEPFAGFNGTLHYLLETIDELNDLAEPDARIVWLDYFSLRQGRVDFKPERVMDLISQIRNVVACIDPVQQAGQLKKNDYVKVVKKTFASDNVARVQLQEGLHGRVMKIDGTGDAKIEFDADEVVPVWMCKENFTKLKVQAGYISRAFCILEVFAAVRGSCTLAVTGFLAGCSRDHLRKCLDPGGTTGPVDAEHAQTWDKKDKETIDAFVRSLPGGFDALNAAVTDAILDAAYDS